jgi:sugar fermentation stimulation protein A
VTFFVSQRGDGRVVAPADAIDPTYGHLLRQAVAAGVEALAYRALVTPAEVVLTQRLAVVLEEVLQPCHPPPE